MPLAGEHLAERANENPRFLVDRSSERLGGRGVEIGAGEGLLLLQGNTTIVW